MGKSIEELITEETTQRLEEMGSETYQFPKKANKTDFIGILAAVFVCLILIILCLMGVIA